MDQEKIKTAARMMIEGIGEDPAREGLLETPDRIARMYEELCGGYEADVAQILSKTFEAKDAEMVVETGIPFYSLCEHHMLPFFGQAHIAYIPDGKITEMGDVVYNDGDAISFPVTITAQADSSGNTFYEYIKKSATT